MSTRKGRYGDGSITLRKDGRYCARYKRKCVYTKTEAEALTKLRKLRNAVDTVAPLFISNTTTAHSLIRAVACGDIQF